MPGRICDHTGREVLTTRTRFRRQLPCPRALLLGEVPESAHFRPGIAIWAGIAPLVTARGAAASRKESQ